MNVTQAVNIALDSNSLVLSRSGGSVPSLASNCRLNVVPNAGAILTVSDDFQIIGKGEG